MTDTDASRIVLLEDEENLRTMVASLLRDSGYQVHETAGGDEAVELVGSLGADILITDIKHPGLTGKAMFDELRKLPSPPRVLVLSGNPGTEVELDSLRWGAAGFLYKPFALDTLLLRLDRVLLSVNPLRLPREARARDVARRLDGKIDLLV